MCFYLRSIRFFASVYCYDDSSSKSSFYGVWMWPNLFTGNWASFSSGYSSTVKIWSGNSHGLRFIWKWTDFYGEPMFNSSSLKECVCVFSGFFDESWIAPFLYLWLIGVLSFCSIKRRFLLIRFDSFGALGSFVFEYWNFWGEGVCSISIFLPWEDLLCIWGVSEISGGFNTRSSNWSAVSSLVCVWFRYSVTFIYCCCNFVSFLL